MATRAVSSSVTESPSTDVQPTAEHTTDSQGTTSKTSPPKGDGCVSSQNNSKINTASATNGTRRRCAAQTRACAPCRALVAEGEVFCSIHAHPERASELGRRSGQSRRRSAVIDYTSREFPLPTKAKHVKGMLAHLLVDLFAGRMDPKLAYTISLAANTFMKAIELDDLIALKELEIFHQEASKRTPEDLAYFAKHGNWPDSPFAQRSVIDAQQVKDQEPTPAQLSARGLVASVTFPEECICFPPEEQPEVPEDCKEERAALAAVRCPLHGERFRKFQNPRFWYPGWIYEQKRKRGWPGHSPQYRKAMLAGRKHSVDENDKLLDQKPPLKKEIGMKSSEGQDIPTSKEQHSQNALYEPDELLDQNSALKAVSTESSASQDIQKFTEQHDQDSADESEELIDQNSAEEEVIKSTAALSFYEIMEQERKRFRNSFRRVLREEQND